mmetsp:Transcript_35293/g.67463  ORF Transcript_35293/g.67463 Transcript_35293/m.67463 type:complete len:487 (-) Transcript_35293:8-1468(-)
MATITGVYQTGPDTSSVVRVVDEDEWVDKLLEEAKKNRKVSIEDIIFATVDSLKFRKEEPAPTRGRGRGGPKVEEEPVEGPRNMRPSSPRSLRACLKLGIDPGELVYRPLTSFPSKNPDLQQIEYNKYEEFRRDLLEKLKECRTSIIQEDAGNIPGKPGPAGGKKSKEEDDMNAMLERENKRVEAAARRNKREMQLILGNETKLQKSRVLEEQKQARLAQMEEQRLVELKRQEQEYRRQQKERELERQRREQAEIEAIKMASMEHFKKQQALAEMMEQQRLKRLEETKREEEARQERAAQQRAEQERAMREEQEALMAKQREMERREVERQKMMAQRKAERIAANAEKRMQTQQKVKTALDAGQKVAETRKKAIQSKMDENEQRLAALARQHAEEEKRRKQENEEKARQRHEKFEEANHIEQMRVQEILERQAKAEEQWHNFQKRFAWEKEKHKVHHKLKLDERRTKVEEMKRSAAYMRYIMRQKN